MLENLVTIDGEPTVEVESGAVNVICESLPEVAWLEYREDMDFPYITKRYSRAAERWVIILVTHN